MGEIQGAQRFVGQACLTLIRVWVVLALAWTVASTAQVTSVQLTSSVGGEQPFMVGLPFKKGDVISDPSLNIPKAQVIVKRRWNDGSVKHAIASGQVVLPVNSPFSIGVLNTPSVPGGTSLNAADIQTANPSASVQLGSFGTVSLSSLLSTPFRTWISGPEMVECHYRSNVGNDPVLSVWFFVRFYKGGRVWVRAVIENGYVAVPDADKIYVPNVTIGAFTFNNSGNALTHYAHTRWTQEAWIGGDPQITIKHDTVYLIDTKLVPHYWKRNPGTQAFNGLTLDYVPMNNGNLTKSMGDGGFQRQLGLLPLWDALYVTSGDSRAWRSMLANSSSMNSYPIVWRDSATNFVARPSDFPTYAIKGGTYNLGAGPYTWEINHPPSEGYLAYLITGDYWHYETALMHASLDYLALNTFNRGSGNEKVLKAETRGTAWNIRNLTHAVAVSPDGDAVAEDYRTLLANNMVYFKNVKNALPVPGIGYLYEYNASLYGPGLIPPWQHHFFIQSVGMGSDLEPLADMTVYNEVRDYLYRGVVGILGDGDGYCFTKAYSYNIKTNGNTGSNPATWYTAWSQVYDETFPGGGACGNVLEGGSAGAPSIAATGYWGNLLPAIAYAVDHGAPGAASSWARLSGASNWPVVEQSGFDDLPLWGIVPRNPGSPAPPERPRRLRIR